MRSLCLVRSASPRAAVSHSRSVAGVPTQLRSGSCMSRMRRVGAPPSVACPRADPQSSLSRRSPRARPKLAFVQKDPKPTRQRRDPDGRDLDMGGLINPKLAGIRKMTVECIKRRSGVFWLACAAHAASLGDTVSRTRQIRCARRCTLAMENDNLAANLQSCSQRSLRVEWAPIYDRGKHLDRAELSVIWVPHHLITDL